MSDKNCINFLKRVTLCQPVSFCLQSVYYHFIMLLCVDIVDIVDTQGKSQYEPTQTLAQIIVEPELT